MAGLNYRESALALRTRSAWEAADSGVLLWRESFAYFIPLFAVPVWVIAFSFRLLPPDVHYWSYLLLWYLKPLFDRLALHVVAVRFFEPEAGLRRLAAGLFPRLLRGLPGDLLWRRFSPWRAAAMPIRMLEGLKHGAAARRRRVLAEGSLNFGIALTGICEILETVLLGGEFLFALVMIQLVFPDLLGRYWTEFGEWEVYLYALYCFNLMLAESLYVCMGFGLYINSRVEIEGWDIQLLFASFVRQV